MFQNFRFSAILLMAGTGVRFGGEKPKQFQHLSGKKIYLHTLEKFVELNCFDEIILVVHSDYVEEVKNDVAMYSGTHLKVVLGGKTRQESSYLGLLQCHPLTDFVVIHDAVRPFVTKEILQTNVEKVVIHGAVDTCAPSFDTIVESYEGNYINRIPNRSHYWRGQTPQSFQYQLIKRAHESAIDKHLSDISDDCRLVLENGHDVHIVPGEEQNLKITTELDLFLAEQLMRLKSCVVKSVARPVEPALKGKTYIVIGGTGGIGRAIAHQLKLQQAVPILISRSSMPYSADISVEQQVRRVFADVERDIGAVDGLINSAGQLKIKELKELSFKEIQELLTVNLHGVIYSCKCCKIKPGGHIINIASSSYTRGRKNYSIYSCAKAGVVNFTQALAEEFSHLNVNTVVPQRTLTPMRTENFPEEAIDSLLDPMDVAKTILELLSQQGLSGQIVEVKKSCH